MSDRPRRRFDASVIATGGLLSGAVGLGGALLVRSWLADDSGPTAASLSEGFGLLFGAAIGLALGAAFAAFAARMGPRLLTGLIAGLLGYVVVLVPVLILTAPSDVSVAESISTAALAAILVAPVILLGAAVGAGIADHRKTGI